MAAKTAQVPLRALPLGPIDKDNRGGHLPKEARKQQQKRSHEQMLLMYPCQHSWEKRKNKFEPLMQNCSCYANLFGL